MGKNFVFIIFFKKQLTHSCPPWMMAINIKNQKIKNGSKSMISAY